MGQYNHCGFYKVALGWVEENMKPVKKKKLEFEDDDDQDVDDGRPVSFDALARLTSSEEIQQVKAGMSRIDPLEKDEITDEYQY